MQSNKTPMQVRPIRTGSSVKTEVSRMKKQPLTHFLSLPIGHHPALRDLWGQTSVAFLESSPAIPGLHESILVKPGSLHLTLGVLSLVPLKQPSVHNRNAQALDATHSASIAEGVSENRTPPLPQHSVDEALKLLRTLEKPIKNMLADHGSLKVPLEYLDVMHSRPNQKVDDSHVMWAGPDLDGETGKSLKRVCDLVHSTLKTAGMLQEDRPLKLHCTLINTLHRKENPTTNQKNRRWNNKTRTPFSFSALLSSSAFKRIASPGDIDTGALWRPNAGPHRVALGTWTVDEVQLCEMGSKNADGVYKSVGSISLR